MSRHTVLGWILFFFFFFFFGEYGHGEYNHLGFFRDLISFSIWHTTLPSLEGPVAKILLQNVRLS